MEEKTQTILWVIIFLGLFAYIMGFSWIMQEENKEGTIKVNQSKLIINDEGKLVPNFKMNYSLGMTSNLEFVIRNSSEDTTWAVIERDGELIMLNPKFYDKVRCPTRYNQDYRLGICYKLKEPVEVQKR